MCWCTDLLFKKNYKSVTKNQCPGILTYYSKTRKSMKMSTLARKNEQLFFSETFYRLFLDIPVWVPAGQGRFIHFIFRSLRSNI